MKNFIIMLMAFVMNIFGTGCSSVNVAPSEAPEEEKEVIEKVDDWQFEPTSQEEGQYAIALQSMAVSSAADSIGLSVGGAKDISNFRENIRNEFLPLPEDITYEGLFYEYFFDTGLDKQPCDKLFCPSYTSAVSMDPFSGEEEYFLAVGLNSGIKQSEFSRKRLNLVIVLDISHSMSSPFDRYYYDQFNREVQGNGNEEEWKKTKMEVASESIAALLDHLEPEDSLGVILFNESAYLAKPLRKVKGTDMEAIKGHVLELQPQGGTNMSAGMKMAGDLLKKYSSENKEEKVENRIIFLTDAQPNVGELSEEGISGLAQVNVKDKIYTTFIGIGMDFNTELIELIGHIRGANYYSVRSPEEFKQRMDTNFDYMVSPLVFNLQLTVDAPGFEVQKVYGSPGVDELKGEVIKISTLFPSETEEKEVRGGLVLLHLKKQPDRDINSLKLNMSYEEQNGGRNSHSTHFKFQDTEGRDHYDNDGIRKGVTLTRYVTIMRNWLLYERTRLQSPESKPDEPITDSLLNIYLKKGIFCFPDSEFRPGRWERPSERMIVVEEYKVIMDRFIPYFRREMKAIGDPAMEREWKLLRFLIHHY